MTPQTDVVLTRTGELPLKITGILLAKKSSQIVNGKDRMRWHKIDVYQARQFVAHIKWRSQWDGEQPHDLCLVAASLHELAVLIRDYDPLEWLAGFPDGKQFERKQERLEQMIVDDWSAMISDLFMTLNVAESL